MKRPAPDGATHVVLSPLQLVQRLVALVPPPRFNLTRFHGVFAPNSKLRPRVVPAPPPPPPASPTPAPTSTPAPTATVPNAPSSIPRTYRIPWAELLRRSFAVDVLTCDSCGARRRVLAFISHLPTARRILQHLHLPQGPPPLPEAGPPQLVFEPLEHS